MNYSVRYAAPDRAQVKTMKGDIASAQRRNALYMDDL